MPASFVQITKQIEALQKQADALLASERPAALRAAKGAVALYGLTAAELGLGAHTGVLAQGPNRAPLERSNQTSRTNATAGTKAPVKYRDGTGNQWTGRGMKPRWLSAAIAAGKSLESFAVAGSSRSQSPPSPKPSAALKSKPGPKSGKALTGVKYKDSEGRTWSGRGPKPHWLSSSLASGKSLDTFRV
jgi:DNA-binding protein H-NS